MSSVEATAGGHVPVQQAALLQDCGLIFCDLLLLKLLISDDVRVCVFCFGRCLLNGKDDHCQTLSLAPTQHSKPAVVTSVPFGIASQLWLRPCRFGLRGALLVFGVLVFWCLVVWCLVFGGCWLLVAGCWLLVVAGCWSLLVAVTANSQQPPSSPVNLSVV